MRVEFTAENDDEASALWADLRAVFRARQPFALAGQHFVMVELSSQREPYSPLVVVTRWRRFVTATLDPPLSSLSGLCLFPL